MTREQLKNLLPEGAEDAVVTAILDAMHAEIKPFKDAAAQAKADLEGKAAELAEISRKAAGADENARALAELQAKYEADLKAANERAAGIEFDAMIDGLLRQKGARNIRAAKSLLDLEIIRNSKNQKEDALSAIEAIASAEDSAFIFSAQPTGRKADVGAPTGGPTPPADGVTTAFKALNPNLNI